MPAVYSLTGQLYAVVESGGYADLSDTKWVGSPAAQQYAVSVRLTPVAKVPPALSERSGAPDVPIVMPFSSTTESSYSQVAIVGTTLFITTDSTDVNAGAYGATATTGHVYSYDVVSGTQTVVVAAGGASSVGASSTGSIYVSSSGAQQKITSGVGTTGIAINATRNVKLARQLWMRSQ
jgi:hypothetical protein